MKTTDEDGWGRGVSREKRVRTGKADVPEQEGLDDTDQQVRVWPGAEDLTSESESKQADARQYS